MKNTNALALVQIQNSLTSFKGSLTLAGWLFAATIAASTPATATGPTSPTTAPMDITVQAAPMKLHCSPETSADPLRLDGYLSARLTDFWDTTAYFVMTHSLCQSLFEERFDLTSDVYSLKVILNAKGAATIPSPMARSMPYRLVGARLGSRWVIEPPQDSDAQLGFNYLEQVNQLYTWVSTSGRCLDFPKVTTRSVINFWNSQPNAAKRGEFRYEYVARQQMTVSREYNGAPYASTLSPQANPQVIRSEVTQSHLIVVPGDLRPAEPTRRAIRKQAQFVLDQIGPLQSAAKRESKAPVCDSANSL